MTQQVARRRALALLVLAIVLWPLVMTKGPEARLEITTARLSVLVETGPLRVQAVVATALARPAALAIGTVTR